MMLKYPYLLFLLIIIPLLTGYYIWKWKSSNPSLSISKVSSFGIKGNSWKVWLMHVVFGLQMLGIAAMIVALCRPQTHDAQSTSRIEGTDIALALDISSSMLASDLQPNRLSAAKDVAQKFINQRVNDNMSLVVFSGESLSLMPLTNDRTALVNALATVQPGMLVDGTAIGDGVSSAINRLTSGKAKSKSIILLTDGTNNAGDVAPATAAQLAKQKGIKIYTIGVGTNGTMQITDPYGFSTTTMETKIDEATLKNMSDITKGKFYRATDSKTLAHIFAEIDSLEKTELDVDKFTHTEEAFMPWLWAALALIAFSYMLRYTLLRRIP